MSRGAVFETLATYTHNGEEHEVVVEVEISTDEYNAIANGAIMKHIMERGYSQEEAIEISQEIDWVA